ncbi:hypothetical protein EDD11_009364 [Mortierella claussenii]|nr:hypothetical protein EDD11_009364 [Mortierella claussenii]
MARQNKDYCCCCIPLRFAVAIISLVALVLGAGNLWSVLKAGQNDSTSRVSAYISAGVYALIGISGLLSAVFKTYSLAKNFSVMWWTVTIVVSILSVINIILVSTREKDDLRAICQQELLKDDNNKYGPLGGNVSTNTALSDDVDSCYKVVVLVAGVSLALQVIIMSLCGWVASRYTGEVKHMHDEQHMYTGDHETYQYQGQPQKA